MTTNLYEEYQARFNRGLRKLAIFLWVFLLILIWGVIRMKTFEYATGKEVSLEAALFLELSVTAPLQENR